MPVARTTLTATIANGASLSDAVDLLGYDLVALAFPAAWTAADVTLQTSEDGVTYRNVMTDAASPAEVVVGADASLHVVISGVTGTALGRFIKIRSGTAAAAVNQLGDRIIKVFGRTEV